MGSALVNLLRAAGYDVEAEYYINDAGNQIDHLAESVNARYLQLCGQDVEVPEDGYRGQDIVETARRIREKDGDKYLSMPEAERLAIFKERALAEKLAALKEDLAAFNVQYDVWFSERTLHPDKVNAAVEKLRANGNIYEKDGALWLRSTDYGDDKDRVVIRAGGEPTYLAADIAYHKDKFERGFGRVINLWGADHHGYICRVKAAIQAMGGDPEKLTVMLLQMVSLLRGGEAVKMSKRTGESVTLAELIEEVGTDAARYFFVMRSPDSQLDFDIEEYPREVEKAAADLAPQRIARAAHEMASAFHSFYSRCRIMGVEPELAGARLALAGKTAQVIRHALHILGVSAPEKM